MTISFDAIRNQVQAATNGATHVAQTSTHKVVEVAKAAGSLIHGVLPVTNNKLERELDALRMEVARLSAQQALDLASLRATLGVPAPAIPQESVEAVALALVSAMGRKPEPARVDITPVAPQTPTEAFAQLSPVTRALLFPELAVEAPVAPVVAPVAPSMPVQMELPISTPEGQLTPTNPMNNILPISQPSNWHLGDAQ
jgi:hypothetical protein